MSSLVTEDSLGNRSMKLVKLAAGIEEPRRRPAPDVQPMRVNKDVLFDSFSFVFQQCEHIRYRKDARVASFLQKFRTSHQALSSLLANPDDFIIKKVIGEGKFGQVQLVTEKRSNALFAMKVISKITIRPDTTAIGLDIEREILAKTDSQWHTKLHYAFHDSTSLYLVMDYHPGGDLMQLLEYQPDILDEDAVRFYTAELIVAVNDLHRMGFIHRDVKPENILIDRCGHLRLADFGSAGRIDANRGLCATGSVEPADFPFGTPNYTPPELLGHAKSRRGITAAVDFWAIGIICYEMAFKKLPFDDARPAVIFSKIQSHAGDLDFDDDASPALRSLIAELLRPSPNDRLDYNRCIQHSFFACVNFEKLADANPPFVPSLESELDTSYFDEIVSRPRRSNNSISNSISSLDTSRSSVSSSGDAPIDAADLPFIGFTYMKDDKSFEESLRRADSSRRRSAGEQSSLKGSDDVSKLKIQLAEVEARLKLKDKELVKLQIQNAEEVTQRKSLASFNENLKRELTKKVEECETAKKRLASEKDERRISEAKMMELVQDIKAKWRRKEAEKVSSLEAQLVERDSEIEKLKAQLHRARQIMLESTNIEGETVSICRFEETLEEIATDHANRQLDTIIEEPTLTTASSFQSLNSTDTTDSTHDTTVKFVDTSRGELDERTYDASSSSLPRQDSLKTRVSSLKRDMDATEKSCTAVGEMVNKFKKEIVEEDVRLESEIAALNAELAKQRQGLEKEVLEKDVLVRELSHQRDEFERKLNEKETELRELQVRERVASARLADQEKTIKKLEEAGSVSTHAKTSDSAAKFLESQVDKMRVKNEDLIAKACRAEQEKREVEEKLAAKETLLNRQALDIRIVQRELKTAEEEKDRIRELYKKLRLASHDEQVERDSLKEKIASLQTNRDQLQRALEEAAAKTEAAVAEKQKEIARLQEKVASLEKEKDELSGEVQAALEKDKFISERDARIASLEKHLEEGENVQQNWSESQNALKEDLLKKEKQILFLTKKCSKLHEAFKKSNENMAEIVEECKRREELNESFEKKIETYRKNYENAKAELLKAKSALNEAESMKLFELKNVNGRLRDLEAKISALEDENKILNERLRQTEQRASKKEQELQYLHREFEMSRDSLATTLTRCSELTTDLSDCKTTLMKVNAEKSDLLTEKGVLETRIGDLNAHVESIKAELREVETTLAETTAKLEERERSFLEHSSQLHATVSQQNKLIEYLHALKEESADGGKKHKGLGSLLGHKTKSSGEGHHGHGSAASVTVIPRQYKDLIRMVEEEKGRRMAVEQELDSARRELAQARGQQMPPAMHGTPVPSTPGARKTLKTICFPAEKAQPTPQRVSHNIPHKFAGLPVSSYAKKLVCARCERSVGLSQQGVRCSMCHIVAHTKCGPVMNEETPFCGLTEEMIRQITEMKDRQRVKDCKKESDSTLEASSSRETSAGSLKEQPQVERPEDDVFEGGVKILANKRDWIPRWLRLDGAHMSVYLARPTSESQFPLETWDVSSVADGHTTVTTNIGSEELPAVHKTDLPFVFKLEKYLENYVWPKKVAYYMAPSFDAKNEWSRVLAAAAGRGKKAGGSSSSSSSTSGEAAVDCDASLLSMDAPPPKFDLIASAPTSAKVTCATMSGDKVIFGGVKGLYVVEFGQSGFVTFSTAPHGQVHSVDVIEKLDVAVIVAGRSKQLFLTNLTQLKNAIGGDAERTLTLVPINELSDVRMVRIGLVTLNGLPLLGAAQKNHINILEWNPHEMAFTAKRRMASNNTSVCGLFRKNSLILGNEKFYEIDLVKFTVEEFIDASDQSVACLTHSMRSHLPRPLDIVSIEAEELMVVRPEYLLCYEDRAVFFDAYGRRSRSFDLKWTRFAFRIEYVEPYLFIQSQSAVEVIEVTRKLCVRNPTPSARRIVDYDHPLVMGSAGGHVLLSVWARPAPDADPDPAVNLVDLIALTGRAFFSSSASASGDLSVATTESLTSTDLSSVDSGAVLVPADCSDVGSGETSISRGRKRSAEGDKSKGNRSGQQVSHQPPVKSLKLSPE